MISVVILTHNRLDKLRQCLKSLREQTSQDFEVLVVDNGSTDGTIEFLTQSPQAERAAAEVMRVLEISDQDVSFAELRNRGCAAARGEVIAFIDDDCRAEQHWIERISQHIKDYDALGGVVLADGSLAWPSWWDAELNWLIGLSPPQLAEPGGSGIFYPQTANLAIRRAVWEAEPFQSAGKKPARSRPALIYRTGREDAQLWRQLRTKGYQVKIEPSLIVYHSISSRRLRLSLLCRRAYNDGWAYYIREQKKEYLFTACYQLLSLPLSVLESWISKKNALYRALLKQGLWAIRQLGFISAYLAEKKSATAWLTMAIKSMSAGLKFIADQAKRPVRRGLFFTHRALVKKRPLSRPPESLLIVSCGFLGDMVIIQPSVRMLREYFPETNLTLLCYKNGKEIYERIPLFDDILACPEQRPEARRLLSEMVWERPYSAMIIHYYHGAPAAPLLWENKTPVIGYDADIGFSRRLWYELIDHPVAKDFQQNELLNSLALLRPFGINEVEPVPYYFPVPEEIEQKIKQQLSSACSDHNKSIAINMGAGYRAKEWSRENWAQLAQALREMGFFVVFVGDRWWRWEARHILEKMSGRPALGSSCGNSVGLNLCGRTSIMELAAVLKQCQLLITTDSGPKHLSFALGVPTVTLYGPTDERRWGALWERDKHRAVRACPNDLTTEELLGLPENYQMLCITPELVINTVKEYLTALEIS